MQQKKTSNMTKVTRDSLFWYSNQQGDVCLHNSVSRIFNSHSGQFPFIYSLQVPALIYEENYKQKQNKEAFSEILTLFYLPIFDDFLAFLDFPQWVIRTICIYSDFFLPPVAYNFTVESQHNIQSRKFRVSDSYEVTCCIQISTVDIPL